ncbi:hypothetical protein ACWCO0_21635 [Streptomyces tubercidicus]|uniref:Uncharacterized protein n=1 Tax=Streptomyces tubercidicus TaxID=47759 RepID=A0A640UIZ8_9ACTN|nr:hypothetical protein [Streptomyces tubercidicus]WAU10855.1 hypothetical protein STRTU_000984 [Streptomyces tubercidicus]GFE36028.1 hypothetical protein Stube_07010 [Streptomyces tubercidicus]
MTTPDLPMLLPPAMVPEPGTLNVSTFAKPEYAKLTFTYGKVKSGGNWPVHCKWFRVRIPTGRQASALTSEPTLIRHELTVPDGKRLWAVDRDTRDPNQVVFTCSPPPNEPAAFDGTWSVQLELWGIEVNGGVGLVDIVWEESTSTTGADGQFQERTGRGEVSKRDDSFYLHSFRPASVAIGRNTKATLHWEGTPHATYTMYYRKPDGTQGASTASGGSWTSPENLVDDSSFTLEAKMSNEVRYLTTYIKVNNPDIAVTGVTTTGNITVDPGANGYIWLKTGRFDTTAEATLNLYGALNAKGALTAGGAVFNNDIIVKSIKSPENGALTIENMPKANPDDKVKVSFANGVLSVTGNGTYSGAISTITVAASQINGRGQGVLGLNGSVTVNGPLAVNESITLAKSKTIYTDYINARVAADGIVVGNNMSMYAGMTLTTNALTVNGNVIVDPGKDGYLWHKTGRLDIKDTANLNVHGALTYNGQRVLRNGDSVTLKAGWATNGYLWDNDGSSTKDQGNVVRKTSGNPVGNYRSRWTLGYRTSNNATALDADGDADTQTQE